MASKRRNSELDNTLVLSEIGKFRRTNAPLDWHIEFSIPWTRENHKKNMFPSNEVLTAFLMGWQSLQTFTDPKLIIEAFTCGVFLNTGAAEFEDSPSNTGFYADSYYRIRVGQFHTEYDGVVVDGFAHHSGVAGTISSASTKYRGEMIPSAHKNSLFPHGYGVETYSDDDSVYSGQFWYGRRKGFGSIKDKHGTIIYMGEWDTNPDGKGIIACGNGVYHQGDFCAGEPTGVLLNLFDASCSWHSSRAQNHYCSATPFRMTGAEIKITGQDFISL